MLLLTSHDDVKLVVVKWQVITCSFDFFMWKIWSTTFSYEVLKHGWKGEFQNGLVYKYVRKFMKINI
jgi:hypothetical protein